MGWIPSGMGIQGMMDALVTAPAATASSDPGGWTPPADPNDPLNQSGNPLGDIWSSFVSGNQADWALLQRLFSSTPPPSIPGGRFAGYLEPLLQQSRSARFEYAKQQGWSVDNPSVQQWVISGGQVPTDTTPPSTTPAAAPGTGTTGTPGASTVAATTAGAALVQTPFPFSMYHNPDQKYGYNFGDKAPPHSYPSGWHEGQDYQVADGTQLKSPFTGTVKYVGYDPAGYGTYVDIQFGDQGMVMRFAHLQYANVKAGQTINMGDPFGISGSTGYSTGPHLLVELRNGQNQPLDPRPLLNWIFNGAATGAGNNGKGISIDAFAATGAVSNAGGNIGSGSVEYTPEGHALYDGTQDRAYYDMVNKEYSHRYGKNAPWSVALAMKAAGVTNSSQMAAVAANWISDIPGMTFDQRDNIFNTANGIAMKNYGRPVPDSLVKRLAAEGLVTPGEIQQWFLTHVASDLPPTDYRQIYDAVNPPIQAGYKDGPPPDYINAIYHRIKAKTPGSFSPE